MDPSLSQANWRNTWVCDSTYPTSLVFFPPLSLSLCWVLISSLLFNECMYFLELRWIWFWNILKGVLSVGNSKFLLEIVVQDPYLTSRIRKCGCFPLGSLKFFEFQSLLCSLEKSIWETQNKTKKGNWKFLQTWILWILRIRHSSAKTHLKIVTTFE